jgi:hypothetical protein
VIKLVSAHIEEVRGIRKLDIAFSKHTFAISGPNGSGKSGVIDAIEFGLTGQIGRLAGRGTKGLSVAEHGPHVDMTKFPDAAFVQLDVFLPALGKSATITRKVSAPRKPKIDPADDDVKAALAEIADHPEITLSRREILRFILVEPTKRSEEIQTILKLEEIGQTRSALNTAQNRLQRTHATCEAEVRSSQTTLQRHLQISTLHVKDLLETVNKRRQVLGLPEIPNLTADTKLDAGLATGSQTPSFNKQSALRDLKALSVDAQGFSDLGNEQAASVVSDLAKLESDPTLLASLQHRSFIEKGLELIDGPGCPLCDTLWDDEQHLREHLSAKLAKSEEAGRLEAALLKKGATLTSELVRVQALVTPVHKLAEGEREADFARILANWNSDLGELKAKLGSLDGLTGLKSRLTTGWLTAPHGLLASIDLLSAKLEAKPDQTATHDAQTFLTSAQLRLDDYREARRKVKVAEIAAKAAKAAYDVYCRVMEDELNQLYEDVQEDFSNYYRQINEEDEVQFTAKFTPSGGSLDFGVNFYERGLFPPGAYHSEGHQDGMGVCLYLALMKRLFGERFSIALLDDVVMSVDSGHRYQFCKLLKTHFPQTQFVLTTHDRVWAEQMKSAGLVTGKTSLVFHGWTIEAGPLVESSVEIWQDIAANLARGKVEAAAGALRRHLEFASRQLAENLGAQTTFHADGNYEMGELLPGVLARLKSLYGKAADAAQSWGNTGGRDGAAARRDLLSSSNGAASVEQWAVNRAVHYNEWANFGRKDFEPVVGAFKELLDCFRCQDCQSWLYTTPSRGNAEALRCSCGVINMNLKAKPK